jgi:hypothetical protein
LLKKDYQKVNEPTKEFLTKFEEVDKSGIVDFNACRKPLDMALWVLCVAKEKLGQTRLTAEQIASTIIYADMPKKLVLLQVPLQMR